MSATSTAAKRRSAAVEAPVVVPKRSRSKSAASVPNEQIATPRALQRKLRKGDRVRSAATVRPKRFAGVVGVVGSVHGDEASVGDAWYRFDELQLI